MIAIEHVFLVETTQIILTKVNIICIQRNFGKKNIAYYAKTIKMLGR